MSYRIDIQPPTGEKLHWSWEVYEGDHDTALSYGWGPSKAQAKQSAERYCDSRSEAETYTYTPRPRP